MNVEILTPDLLVYKGEASGIQLPGVSGSFEILNNHAPLIAALKTGPLRLNGAENGATSITWDIKAGFVEVLNNHIIVLTEGAKKEGADK
ncbi:MAG: ATP synthase F1 subunit epsilon [Chitinophagales bacterium]